MNNLSAYAGCCTEASYYFIRTENLTVQELNGIAKDNSV